MSLETTSDARLKNWALATQRLHLLEEAERLEGSLTEFLSAGWRYIDPAPFIPGWHLDAIAEHLEAVTNGGIKRLIINVPPRTSKSSLVSVAWPAWTWTQSELGPLAGPQVQFLFASYAQSLSTRDSVKTRRLIESPIYQKYWGGRFRLTGDQNTKTRFENDKGGYRLATSVGGALTGEGASICVCDDIHNAMEVESEAVRTSTLMWWDEALSTRLNDPRTGAYVVIMQRLHEEDLTGHLLAQNHGDWVHLCLPMRHDPSRHCVTTVGWEDPRKEDGDLLCPERFGPDEVDDLERRLGPFAAAGQLDQAPTPRGGGIIKRDWWQVWKPDRFPQCQFVLASLDTAYTEKEENDPSALTVWGVYREGDTPPKIILLYAWQGRLELHDLVVLIGTMCSHPNNNLTDEAIKQAKLLLGKNGEPAKDVPRLPVDRLIIESKASGISVAQELRRLYSHSGAFGVELVDPTRWGDKVARMYAVQHMFSDGMIYAPERKYAEMVIDQVAAFPKATHDDLCDATSLALRYLRLSGMAERSEEHAADLAERLAYRPKDKPLYWGR